MPGENLLLIWPARQRAHDVPGVLERARVLPTVYSVPRSTARKPFKRPSSHSYSLVGKYTLPCHPRPGPGKKMAAQRPRQQDSLPRIPRVELIQIPPLLYDFPLLPPLKDGSS